MEADREFEADYNYPRKTNGGFLGEADGNFPLVKDDGNIPLGETTRDFLGEGD